MIDGEYIAEIDEVVPNTFTAVDKGTKFKIAEQYMKMPDACKCKEISTYLRLLIQDDLKDEQYYATLINNFVQYRKVDFLT